MPSIKDDEELARALQEEYRRDYEASRTRQQQRPPPTAPAEDTRPVRTTTTAVPPQSSIESDEKLARRLSQEMKDEEVARRLSVQQSDSSRPRPSSSTRMHSRTRGGYMAGAPVVEAVTHTSSPRSVRRHSAHSRSSTRHTNRERRSTSKKSRRSSDGNGERRESSRRSSSDVTRDRENMAPPGRRASDWTRTTGGIVDPGISRESSGRNNQSSPRGHLSSSHRAHSSQRGRGSAVSPAVEPAFVLPATSVDPPFIAATVVDTSTPVTMTDPYSVTPASIDPDLELAMRLAAQDKELIPTSAEPDVELAIRLAQEERDAALAQQLERSDQEIASRNATRLASAASRPRPSTCRRVASVLVPMFVVVSAAAVIFILVAGRGDLSNLPGVFDNDPFGGTNPSDASKWKTKGGGLQLEVVNAMQEQWWNNFNLALDEWDAGTPDALTLTRSIAEYDYNCSPIQGKMKVCNGDYGDTRWKGINQLLLSGGWIVSSTAKMNEFYLSGASAAQRQYTTCHEIGKHLVVRHCLI